MSLTSSDLLFLLISAFITFVILNVSVRHKSFFQIHLEISKPKQTEDQKIAIIDRLHRDIHEYSNEEILFFNLVLKKKLLRYWCNVLLVILILIFSVMRALLEGYGILIVTFSIFIIWFSPIIWLLKVSNKLGIARTPVRTIIHIFFRHLMEIVIAYLFFILFLSIISTYAPLLFSIFSLNEPMPVYVLKPGPNINSPAEIELGSIGSNQFSLAGFYFTLAIGGTVIFSIIKSHHKQTMKLNSKLISDVDYYEEWFEKYKDMLSFKSLDIRSFNFDKLNDFYQALSDLRSEFNISRVIELENPIVRYRILCFLIGFSYFMGFITIFVKEFLLMKLFYLFILISSSLIYLSYRIFQDYGS